MPSTVTIICGHYGCGKTNLTLNLALEAAAAGETVTVVDMDIVNPYFRSSEYGKLLEEKGIELIAPASAGTTLDTPALPAAIYSVFAKTQGHTFMDVGGDDAGAMALSRYAGEIAAKPYEMLYVINKYRVLSTRPEEAVALLREIEQVSRLKATGIVNNSHLGVDTRPETVEESRDFAAKVAALANLPLLYSTAPLFAYEQGMPFKGIERLVQFPWEMPENN